MFLKNFIILSTLMFFLSLNLNAQVLGSCGGDDAKAGPKKTEISESRSNLNVQPVPLPGQYAIDFELPAVVGNDIINIKLSDYNGKWRIVCFFPAAFTFV